MMIEMYKKVVLYNYANFNGRIRRKEYLTFVLVHILLIIILSKIENQNLTKLTFGETEIGLLGLIYNLFILIPLIAATVRRIHDVGKSGWYVLIPFYNVILICTGGEEVTNKYGEDPIDEMEYLRELGKDLN